MRLWAAGHATLGASAEWSDFVPVAALLFTVASFWWIYVRRGRLRASEPWPYAGIFTGSTVRLRLPLAVYNTGAASIILDNLRLHLDGFELEWRTLRRTLRPQADHVLDYGSLFVVEGRTARQLFVEFGDDGGAWQPADEGPQRAVVDWHDGRRWKQLIEFTWWPPAENRGVYIAHRNARGGPEDTVL
jgi:hypothetical protein